MNPWDPNQGVQMTLQTTAVARQLQLQWLAAQQQAQAQEEEEEEEETSKVVCTAPDEEMGFLLNLPPPCNVLTSPSTIGISGPLKVKPRPVGPLMNTMTHPSPKNLQLTVNVINEL